MELQHVIRYRIRSRPTWLQWTSMELKYELCHWICSRSTLSQLASMELKYVLCCRIRSRPTRLQWTSMELKYVISHRIRSRPTRLQWTCMELKYELSYWFRLKFSLNFCMQSLRNRRCNLCRWKFIISWRQWSWKSFSTLDTYCFWSYYFLLRDIINSYFKK